RRAHAVLGRRHHFLPRGRRDHRRRAPGRGRGPRLRRRLERQGPAGHGRGHGPRGAGGRARRHGGRHPPRRRGPRHRGPAHAARVPGRGTGLRPAPAHPRRRRGPALRVARRMAVLPPRSGHTAMPAEALDPALRGRIQSLLDANRVVLFMKGEPAAPQCGFSARAVSALSGIGLDEYAHVNVLADGEIREGIKAYGDWPTIPQLYIDGELVGGSDIIEQMANSGELQTALGLPPPDRTPPEISISEGAAAMLKQALADAGEGYALKVSVDPRFNAQLQAEPHDPNAIASESAGIRVQFDLASARRA